jgi:DNA-binding transcriptional LysR family regulator
LQSFCPLPEREEVLIIEIQSVGVAYYALSSLREGRTNKLRLGASITASHRLARDNLLLFHEHYPDVLVTVTRTVPRELVKGLEEGRFDLCFGLELPESSLFIREEVFTTDLVVYLRSRRGRPPSSISAGSLLCWLRKLVIHGFSSMMLSAVPASRHASCWKLTMSRRSWRLFVPGSRARFSPEP